MKWSGVCWTIVEVDVAKTSSVVRFKTLSSQIIYWLTNPNIFISQVLRIGSWNRLHKEVRDVTLDDIVKRSNGRIKQENKSSESLDFLEKKKRSYENEIDEFTKECDSNETVRSILFKYFGLWLRLLLDFFYFILQNLSPERFQKLEKDIAKLKEDIEAVDKFIEDAKKAQEEKIANALQELKNDFISNADVICTTLEACHNSDLENIFLGYYCYNFYWTILVINNILCV